MAAVAVLPSSAHRVFLRILKTKLWLLALLIVGFDVPARIGIPVSYSQLTEKATLIVIATPIAVTLTNERTAIADSNVEGKGIETTFRILTILKGTEATNTLVLHHFALANARTSNAVYSTYGPNLISFDPTAKKQYLMFLRRGPDGRYIPATRQYDAADAVKIMEPSSDFSIPPP